MLDPQVHGDLARSVEDRVRGALSGSGDKARRVIVAMRGLMPNICGPHDLRRHLLVSVVHSVMLYGTPTWGADLAYSRTGPKQLAAVQHLAAIASVGAYSTVSYDAVTVVARNVPIDLMAQERFTSDRNWQRGGLPRWTNRKRQRRPTT